MFNSKFDKLMCFACLHILGFYFGLQLGNLAYMPFAAAATLALGLAVVPATKKDDRHE